MQSGEEAVVEEVAPMQDLDVDAEEARGAVEEEDAIRAFPQRSEEATDGRLSLSTPACTSAVRPGTDYMLVQCFKAADFTSNNTSCQRHNTPSQLPMSANTYMLSM